MAAAVAVQAAIMQFIMPGSIWVGASRASAAQHQHLFDNVFAHSGTVRLENLTGMIVRYDAQTLADLVYDLETECVYTELQERDNALQEGMSMVVDMFFLALFPHLGAVCVCLLIATYVHRLVRMLY